MFHNSMEDGFHKLFPSVAVPEAVIVLLRRYLFVIRYICLFYLKLRLT